MAQDGYLFSKGLEAIKMNTASGLPDITDDEISRIFKEADNRDGNYSWETTRKNRYHLVLTRAIKSLTTQETIGYTYTEITENAFSNIYKDMNLGENADVFVLSQDGIVISSRGGEASSGVAVKDKSIIDKLNNSIRQKDGYTFTANIGGKDYLVAYAQIQDVPWYTVYTVPFAYINSEVSKIGWFILAT